LRAYGIPVVFWDRKKYLQDLQRGIIESSLNNPKSKGLLGVFSSQNQAFQVNLNQTYPKCNPAYQSFLTANKQRKKSRDTRVNPVFYGPVRKFSVFRSSPEIPGVVSASSGD